VGAPDASFPFGTPFSIADQELPVAYTTIEDARNYLGIGASVDDALLAGWIPAAQSQIDQRCRRTFEATSDSTRYYGSDDFLASEWATHAAYSMNLRGWDPADRYYLQRSSGILNLGEDIVSVTSLTNGNGVVITPDKYWLLPRNSSPKNAIKLMSTSAWNINTDQEIVVTGRFGYSLAAPADITLATHELIAYWYRSRDSQVFEVIELPGGQIMVPRGFPAVVEAVLTRGAYVKQLGVT